MKNKGFVMIETIIVLSVLSVGLIVLYSSYALILTKTTTKSKYDNTEYIYKAYFAKTYVPSSVATLTSGQLIKTIYDKDNAINLTSSSDFDVICQKYNIKKVYITRMNTLLAETANKSTLLSLDGSTIDYVRSLNDYTTTNQSNIRIIFKFVETTTNGGVSIKQTNFASLQYLGGV